MSEQTLDLKGSLRLIRRFWRTVAVFVLVGLVAGGAYERLQPPEYHATSLVLLPTGSASATGSGATPANALTTMAVSPPARRFSARPARRSTAH